MAREQAGWAITYKAADGKMKTTLAGMRVLGSSLSGEGLTAHQFRENARKVMLRARKRWNELDTSDKRRYTESELCEQR